MAGGGYVLGVDFGTSNTVAMLRRPDGRVAPLLFDGTPVLPSAVCATPAGLSVGRDALHHGRHHPDALELNPKRRIDDGTVLLGAGARRVVDVIGAVFERVGHEAARVAGRPPDTVVLSHPAGWGPVRRLTLIDAAASAGLPVPVLVAEPAAAARYFVSVLDGDLSPAAALMVYDLGAGTFDVSVVRPGEAAAVEILGGDGLDDVGGLDVDAAIVGWLRDRYDADSWVRLDSPSSNDDRRLRHDLWTEARVAKEMLSRTASVLLRPPLLDAEVPLTLAEFEGIVGPLVDRTVRTVQGLARRCGVEVARVLLVGGSSRIPLVATALHRAFGVAPTVTEQPETVVAQGCVLAPADTVAPVSPAGPVWPVSPASSQSLPAQREPWTSGSLAPVSQATVLAGSARRESTPPAAAAPARRHVPEPPEPPDRDDVSLTVAAGDATTRDLHAVPDDRSGSATEELPAAGRPPAPRPRSVSAAGGGPAGAHQIADRRTLVHPTPDRPAAVQPTPDRPTAAQPTPDRPTADRPQPPRQPRSPATSLAAATVEAAAAREPTGSPARRRGGGRLSVVLLSVLVLLAAGAVVLLAKYGPPTGDTGRNTGDTPTARSTPNPSFPNWPVRYADSLATPRGWTPTAEPAVSAECAFRNGRLEIDMKIAGIFRCPGQRDELTDFALRMDVYLLDGQSCAGIWFRRNAHEDGKDSGYLLKVCRTEMVLGHHHADGRIVDFAHFTVPTIVPETRALVGLVVRGGEIGLYLNDLFVGRDGDTSYKNGRVALGIAVPREIGAGQVGFRNIELRTPKGT